MNVLLRDVEVDARRVDVLVEADRVSRVQPRITPPRGAEVIDGRGGALIPGLHDHHLHVLAMAAARSSVQCGPPDIRTLRELAAALAAAPAGPQWIRGVGYHESVAGPLDRRVLDRLVPHRPLRIQHRSGALWMLNSAALERVAAALDETLDVERDEDGEPTGRLWRFDTRLRAALPADPAALEPVAQELLSLGITGVTDATPDPDPTAAALIAHGLASGDSTLRVTVMGAAPASGSALRIGPRKLLLRDHDLPGYDELVTLIAAGHEEGRAVAVHCVTRESLLLALAALSAAGVHPGDRIEHAAVVPAEAADEMVRLRLRVVTQPGFIRERGDQYLREVDHDDRELLYPYASLHRRGVRVAPSSDAPFGAADPWDIMRAAMERRTAGGVVLSADERVEGQVVLSGYMSRADDPGGSPRRVAPGTPADLCLLHVPLREALCDPHREVVRTTVSRGRVHRGS